MSQRPSRLRVYKKPTASRIYVRRSLRSYLDCMEPPKRGRLFRFQVGFVVSFSSR